MAQRILDIAVKKDGISLKMGRTEKTVLVADVCDLIEDLRSANEKFIQKKMYSRDVNKKMKLLDK